MSNVRTACLSDLIRSPLNMRKGEYNSDSIAELAALIGGQGLINPLSVVEELDAKGKLTGRWEVVAGGRRLAAHQLLVKNGAMASNEPVLIKVYEREQAKEVSLSENSGREAPHATDEFEAFRELMATGRFSVEDVAARYGVKVTYVKQRLKLAGVAPEFIQMCREDELSLSVLEALALTDDHAEQRRVWKGLGKHQQQHAHHIRSALTTGEVSMASAKATFVGLAAYEKAGGQVRHDLFDATDSTLMDGALLDRLVIAKLQKAADKETAAGANWVEILVDDSHSIYSDFPEVKSIRVAPTPEQKALLDRLEAEHEKLDDEFKAEEEPTEDRIDVITARMEAIRKEIAAIEDSCWRDDPNQLECAGAVVAIKYTGKLVVYRNRLRAKDARRIDAARLGAQSSEGGDGAVADLAHSDALIRRLTAHRTAALQVELASRPDIALVAITAQMLSAQFRVHEWVDEGRALALRGAGVGITLSDPALHRNIADFSATPAAQAMAQTRAEIDALIRDEVKNGDVFGWLVDKPQATVMRLMAFCTATAIDTVEQSGGGAAADGASVAEAVALDMRRWWKPTADAYFKAVTKPVMLKAIEDVTGEKDGGALALLKKAELAKHAESVVEAAGWKWLPAPMQIRA
jgi:ParB family chromosome partitioning protein